MARFLATGEATILSQRLELCALHRDGHEFAIELTISVLDTAGNRSFNAFARDVTERKAAEELLERQRHQLVEAQSVGGFGSWEWDVIAGTVEWSDELCRIYGREPGTQPSSFEEAAEPVHLEDRARLGADFEASLRSGAPLDTECRIVRPDGAVRTTQTLGEVVRDEQGAPLRMVGTVQDVTERYEAERIKDEFISIVSHELRTPLTSIRGSLGLLESGMLGALPAQGQRMVEIAVQNTDRLVRLINDILDIERIKSGQIDMHPVSCDGSELIEQAAEALASVAAAADVNVVTSGEPVRLSADSDRVIQTLTNLIANAVKFSPPRSSVEVSCSHRDEDVLFEVRDQGRGIRPKTWSRSSGASPKSTPPTPARRAAPAWDWRSAAASSNSTAAASGPTAIPATEPSSPSPSPHPSPTSPHHHRPPTPTDRRCSSATTTPASPLWSARCSSGAAIG